MALEVPAAGTQWWTHIVLKPTVWLNNSTELQRHAKKTTFLRNIPTETSTYGPWRTPTIPEYIHLWTWKYLVWSILFNHQPQQQQIRSVLSWMTEPSLHNTIFLQTMPSFCRRFFDNWKTSSRKCKQRSLQIGPLQAPLRQNSPANFVILPQIVHVHSDRSRANDRISLHGERAVIKFWCRNVSARLTVWEPRRKS